MMPRRRNSDEAIVAVKPTTRPANLLRVRRAKDEQGMHAWERADTVPGSACHTRSPHAYHRVSDHTFNPSPSRRMVVR